MKLRVYSLSGPSWQPVKNGKAYNKWVGTIQYSDVEHVIFGKRYSVVVSGLTKSDVETKLSRYFIGQVVEVSPKNLGGCYATTK